MMVFLSTSYHQFYKQIRSFHLAIIIFYSQNSAKILFLERSQKMTHGGITLDVVSSNFYESHYFSLSQNLLDKL